MDNNWRTTLAPESRHKIVRRIWDTLQRHMPVAGQDGADELLMIAWRFEEKVFQAATDQQDYLRKISLKMLSLETEANRANVNPLPRAVPPQADPAQALVNGLQLPGQAQQQQTQQQQLQQQQPQAMAQLITGLNKLGVYG